MDRYRHSTISEDLLEAASLKQGSPPSRPIRNWATELERNVLESPPNHPPTLVCGNKSSMKPDPGAKKVGDHCSKVEGIQTKI